MYRKRTMIRLMRGCSIFLLLLSCASARPTIDSAEYQARRQATMNRVPDGMIALHSVAGLRRWDESGLHQDARLFTMVPPRPFAPDLHGTDVAVVKPGPESEAALKIDHVVPWDAFVSFVESRLKANPKLVLYLDSAGQTGACRGT